MTRENIEQLGFVDVDDADGLLDRAFREGDQTAMRAAFVIAQWIVLSQEFDIPKAVPRLNTHARPSGFLLSNSTSLVKGIGAWVDSRSSFGDVMSQALRYVRIMF